MTGSKTKFYRQNNDCETQEENAAHNTERSSRREDEIRQLTRRRCMKKIQYIIPLAAMLMGASASAALIASESFSTGNGSDYVTMTVFNTVANSNVLIGTTGFTNVAGKAWYPGTSIVQPSATNSLTHVLVKGSTANGSLYIRTPNTAIGRNSARSLADTPSGSSFYMSGLVSALNVTNSINVDDNAAMGLIGSIPVNTWTISSGIHLGLSRDSIGDMYLVAFPMGNSI
jgi:hypothetical protein